MEAKSAKQCSASSSEYTSSSEEDDQLMNRKGESESEDEDTDSGEESEETMPKPNNPTENVQEEDDDLPEKDGNEPGDSDPNPKSVSHNPTEKIQEEDDGNSEENDSEAGESDQDDVFRDQNPVDKGNKKSQTETVPPAAASIKIISNGGDLKEKRFPRVWSLEDEKTLLNSMIQFRSETDKEIDSSTMRYFCYFLRGKLSFTESPEPPQVSQKIKALRSKYSRNRSTKKHDVEMKEIATQLWNLEANSQSPKRKLSLLGEQIGKLGNPRLEEKLKSLYKVEPTEALEQKIKKQKILEIKEEMKGTDLKNNTFKLILDVHKNLCNYTQML